MNSKWKDKIARLIAVVMVFAMIPVMSPASLNVSYAKPLEDAIETTETVDETEEIIEETTEEVTEETEATEATEEATEEVTEDETEETTEETAKTTVIDKGILKNPIYKDIHFEGGFDTYTNDTEVENVKVDSINNAVSEIRKQLVARTNSFTLEIQSDTDVDAIELLEKSFEHTGVGNEGDYIRYNYHQAMYETSKTTTDDGVSVYTIVYTVEYMTTASQENEATQCLNNILSELKLSDKTDVEKITSIYNYICENVTYDYDGLEDETDILKYSSYGAIVEKNCVCQGYATMFYRMCLEAGIDARVITGQSRGENHAWNIVKIGDEYYNVDSTWDAGCFEYSFFLKCDGDFADHDDEDPNKTAEYTRASGSYEFQKENKQNEQFKYEIYQNRINILNYIGTDKEVVVPAAIEDYPVYSIAGYAFADDNNIEKITIEEGIKVLGEYAVSCCRNVKEINLPASIVNMSQFFDSLEQLETITMPDDGKYYCVINNVLFTKDMKTLVLYPAKKQDTSYEIPSGVVCIGLGAFSYQEYLQKLDMPNSLKKIGYWAFMNCAKLEEINFSENCEFIGQYAFHNCGIKRIELAKSPDIFILEGSIMPQLEYIDLMDAGVYFSENGMLYTRDENEDVMLVRIPDAMSGDIVISEDTKYIINYAILDASNIDSILLPAGLASIWKYNFETTKDEFVIKGYSNTYAERYAKEKNFLFESLGEAEITVLDSGAVTETITWQLTSDYKLTISGEGEMPDYAKEADGTVVGDLETIPWSGYRNVINGIKIEEGITKIGFANFACCQSNCSVDMPNSLVEISPFAFWQNNKLSSINISDSVKIIGHHAFELTEECEEINIPAGVEEIGQGAFNMQVNSKLVRINVDEDNQYFKSVDGALLSKDGKTLYCVPRYIETDDTGYRRDTYCVPDGVETIKAEAIYEIKVTELVLPDSVTCIEDNALVCQEVYRLKFGKGLTIHDFKFSLPFVKEVYVPNTLKLISSPTYFAGLVAIFYEGTEEEYANIKVSNDNVKWKAANVYYNSKGDEHEFGESFVVLEPTCEEEGILRTVCENDGFEKDVAIPALGHDYCDDRVVKATATKDGKIIQTCSRCGKETVKRIIYKASSISLAATEYVYTGKEIKPAVTVKNSKGYVISTNHYTVSYTNNIKAGKATVTITFKGYYTGKVTKSFAINPKGTSIKTLTPRSKSIRVEWYRQDVQISCYYIMYSTKSDFSNAKAVTVPAGKVACTIPNLKSGQTYYFKIRTERRYVKTSGEIVKYKSKWSKVVSAKAK